LINVDANVNANANANANINANANANANANINANINANANANINANANANVAAIKLPLKKTKSSCAHKHARAPLQHMAGGGSNPPPSRLTQTPARSLNKIYYTFAQKSRPAKNLHKPSDPQKSA